MADFDAFMTSLATLPPMGATPAQSDLAFWREVDDKQRQANTTALKRRGK